MRAGDALVTLGFMKLLTCLLVVCIALPACISSTERREATSLLGAPLMRPVLDAETRERLELDLHIAREALHGNESDEMSWVWYGRRQAYLGRYRDAVDTFSTALERHPNSARLLRHRGHRWITLRKFERAVADLARAAELARDEPDRVEPDGAPNAAGIPISSTWSNIQYHLGLAHYLLGDFETSHDAFRDSLATPLSNADKVVSAGHWSWQCLQRLGRPDDARRLIESIPVNLVVVENHSYRDLIELYRSGPPAAGAHLDDVGVDPSAASYAYGYAGWLRAHGHVDDAEDLLRRIADETSWAAFGHIAAEADLAVLANSATSP